MGGRSLERLWFFFPLVLPSASDGVLVALLSLPLRDHLGSHHAPTAFGLAVDLADGAGSV